MEITLLGTSSMVPTVDRNHSASLLSYRDEKILIDCGEGTQRQIRKAKISPMKITKILITHWHGDHILGLPGLLLTLGSNGYDKVLEIYGPKGTKKNFEKMFTFYVHKNKDLLKYKVYEVEEGEFFENKWFTLSATVLDHSTRCLAYAFVEKDRRKINMDKLKKKGVTQGKHLKQLQEGNDITHDGKKIKVKEVTTLVKGKKVAHVTDTVFTKSAVHLAKNADILFCEATFLSALKERAKNYKHMTAKDAAKIAKQAKVKKLVLIHFSQRYKSTKDHVKEAKEVFSPVVAGKDLQSFVL